MPVGATVAVRALRGRGRHISFAGQRVLRAVGAILKRRRRRRKVAVRSVFVVVEGRGRGRVAVRSVLGVSVGWRRWRHIVTVVTVVALGSVEGRRGRRRREVTARMARVILDIVKGRGRRRRRRRAVVVTKVRAVFSILSGRTLLRTLSRTVVGAIVRWTVVFLGAVVRRRSVRTIGRAMVTMGRGRWWAMAEWRRREIRPAMGRRRRVCVVAVRLVTVVRERETRGTVVLARPAVGSHVVIAVLAAVVAVMWTTEQAVLAHTVAVELARNALDAVVHGLGNALEAVAFGQLGALAAAETKSLGQEQFLHEDGLLELDELHLHGLELGDLSLELGVELGSLVLLGEEFELGRRDDGVGPLNIGHPNRTLLLELDGKVHVVDLLAIDEIDVHCKCLLLVHIIEVHTGELPVGDQEATLFRGDGAGAEAVRVLGKGLSVQKNISVTT